MSVISVFLDKDKYFNKHIKVAGYEINCLADIINFYLNEVPLVDTIYIAGACYGRDKSKLKIDELVYKCFGDKKPYDIYLMRKYRGFSYSPTDQSIEDNNHNYLGNKYDTKKSDHRKMIYFESNKKIIAILIGSSNYSPSTYLDNRSSEADILMIDNPNLGNKNANANIIKLQKHFARIELDDGGAIKKNYDSLINKILVSESLNGDGYLQSMFDGLKNDSDLLKYE